MNVVIYISPEATNHTLYYTFANAIIEHLKDHRQITLIDNLSTLKTDTNIFHIIGPIDKNSAKIINYSKEHQIPYLLSPLGCFTYWHIHKNDIRKRIRVARAIKDCASLHISNKIEYTHIIQMPKDKLSIIKNAIITNDTNCRMMANEFELLYQKIIDSNTHLTILKRHKKVISNLLVLSLIDNTSPLRNALIKETKKITYSLNKEEWRAILIYTKNQQILENIFTGLINSAIVAPTFKLDNVDVFAYKEKPYAKKIRISYKSRNLPLIMQKIESLYPAKHEKEKKICLYLLKLKNNINKGKANILDLIKLYGFLTKENFDESILKDMVLIAKEKMFCERILFVTSQVINLGRGYYPWSPKKDKLSLKMLKAITKTNA